MRHVSKTDGPERDFYFALKRLYQLERMTELEGPQSIIDNIKEQLKESYAKLGDDLWNQVHKQYPEFKANLQREEAQQKAWETACESCEHWDGSADDPMNDSWCGLYERREVTKPNPCPSMKLRLKVIN